MTEKQIDIKIPNIEKELAGALAATSYKENNKSSKACLFTLVIYAYEERRVNYLQELVETILDKFPCRIIFIKANSSIDESYFRVMVSNVNSGQSTSAVTCDQIIIETSYDQIFRVPFVIIPHIVPDLPLYLLWGHNPFEDKQIFPHLKPYATRVIFDSECADSIMNFCKEMEHNLATLHMDIMDISWALTSNWRDLLIQLFDTPDKVEDLTAIKSIIINYNAHTTDTTHHPEIRPLYLQAWLACCLGWKFSEMEYFDTSPVYTYVGNVHPSIVALCPSVHKDLPSGAITGIDIETTNGTSYVLSRNESLSQVLVHISTKEACQLPFTLPLPNVHRGLTFMREIFFNTLGDRYKGMLKVLSEIFSKQKQ